MKTSFISAYNLEALAQTNGTHEITVNTSKEFYALHDYLVFTLGWDCYEYAHVSQDGSVTINIRVNNNQPEPTNPDNTPSTMNANEIRESISRLRYELQEYHNDVSKGGANRQRNMAMLVEDIARLEATANKKGFTKVKTMQDLENQALRLTQRNWCHFNGWSSVHASETIKALWKSREALINSAYLNAAAKYLTEKAKAIDGFLNVRPIHEAFCVALEYNSPSVGMALKIASPFCVESFLTNPDQVLEKLNA